MNILEGCSRNITHVLNIYLIYDTYKHFKKGFSYIQGGSY